MESKDLFEDDFNVGDVSSNSQFFKTYGETKVWLDEIGVREYRINKKTLVVDVDGVVNLSNKKLNHIPVKFGKGCNWFNVTYNQNLKSLIGCPDSSTFVYCNSTKIKNFIGLGSVRTILAYNIQSLESFEGLPNELRYLSISGSCHKVNSLDHFPKIISGRLNVGPDFKWFDSLYKHIGLCNIIYLVGEIEKYSNILKLLYVKGVDEIISNTVAGRTVTNILNAEIQRQPDPRKRNLLKVAQELSNAGFHHLTV